MATNDASAFDLFARRGVTLGRSADFRAMFNLVLAAVCTCLVSEVFETEAIYGTDEYSIAKKRIELAKKRLEEAEAQVAAKGERKNARLEQAQVALVHAEQKLKQLCMTTGRTFTLVMFLGMLSVRAFYGEKVGLLLPFEIPRRFGFLCGMGEGADPRAMNPTCAFFIVTYMLRVIFGDLLGRKARQIDAYWSQKDTERYMAAHKQAFANLSRDGSVKKAK